MSYNAVPTVSTGDTWSAANHNTYIRDNFAAGVPDIFTAEGDLAYATAANVATPLAIGTAGTPLVSNGSIPIWGSFAYKRLGGSATDWSTGIAETTDAGSSDIYTPAKSIIQCGVALATSSSDTEYVTAYITFPVAYTGKPIIIFSIDFGSYTGYFQGQEVLNVYDGTRASLRATFSVVQGAGNVHSFHWIAIGPIA